MWKSVFDTLTVKPASTAVQLDLLECSRVDLGRRGSPSDVLGKLWLCLFQMYLGGVCLFLSPS